MPLSVSDQKAKLREKCKTIRKGLGNDLRKDASKTICLCLAMTAGTFTETAVVCAEDQGNQEEVKQEGNEEGESQASEWFQKFRDISNRAGEEFSKAMSTTATAVKNAVSDDEDGEAAKESE